MTVTGQAWNVLRWLPGWQMTDVPRADGGQPGNALFDARANLRVQALASAYGSGDPVAMAWLRKRAGGQVRVIAPGPPASTLAAPNGNAPADGPSQAATAQPSSPP